MDRSVTLIPGQVSLSECRAIYGGAEVALDSSCRDAVEAAAATVAAIVAKGAPVYGINTGFGKLASIRIDAGDLETLQRNLVLSHSAGVGEPLPAEVVRLVIALKIAALAQGASGVRWATVKRLTELLRDGPLPVIPAQGSVGASGDLAPLAHLAAAAFLGVGPGALPPITLGPKEGLALLNGTQVSTALALAGLFEAERVFHAALVTGALSTDAAKGSDVPFDPRIQTLRRQPGQVEVAATLKRLIAGSSIRASHIDCAKIQDPYCLRCQPQVMGAVLDLMRQAAATLAAEANGVSDNPLVFPETGEVLSGGNFHAEPVAFAADMIAMALCEIGSIAERRITMLTDPALSGLPAFLTPKPGLNSGFMIPQVTAAALVAENRGRAMPASVDSIPTSANQEDHVSMATHGARRLLPMAANAANVIAIELLTAAQGCDFHAPMRSSERLEPVRALLRSRVAHLEDDRYMAADIEVARDLVFSGELVRVAGPDLFPGIEI